MGHFEHRLPAVLVLSTGEYFLGYSCGCSGSSVGEVVFNTSMTGYQEILTDPSYCRQMVVFTSPHVGSTGVNLWDYESDRVHLSGIIVKDLVKYPSNWQITCSLSQFLLDNGIVGIESVDTRALTILLRNGGSRPGCIYSGQDAHLTEKIDECLLMAKEFGSLVGVDLSSLVTCSHPVHWNYHPDCQAKGRPSDYRVVVLDLGVKRSILNSLAYSGCDVIVLPASTSEEKIFSYNPDGVVLSNGPGDPSACLEVINLVKKLIIARMPLLGICLGHQILAIANGLKVSKMCFGHHGVNHPVKDVSDGRVFVTAQNHCFVVDEESISKSQCCQVTYRSLFDQSIQGLSYSNFWGMSFQGHPEGGGGPRDLCHFFSNFVALMAKFRGWKSTYAS